MFWSSIPSGVTQATWSTLDWHVNFENKSVDEMPTEFHTITLNICEKNVPIKNKTKKKAIIPRNHSLLIKKYYFKQENK